MRILSYEASSGSEDDLHFLKMDLGKINLIVGNSGAGKTRLLNTIFNGARLVTRKDKFYIGFWDITLEHDSNKYRWIIKTSKDEEEVGKVVEERILSYKDEKEIVLVDRTDEYFLFNGDDLPKLSLSESSITLLQDEKLIKPLYEALTLIMRRNFSGSVFEEQSSYQSLPQSFLKKIRKSKSLKDLFHSGLNLNCKLYVLSKVFKDIYDKICGEFIATFPFVSEAKLLNAEDFGISFPGIVPVFALKEKYINKWIALNEFSSGMKKVLLILCDIHILPEDGCVYLIDEYENSLGVNAINFFPSVLFEAETKSQFIITSHHPYIIGNVPVKDWIIVHRKGNQVNVKQGVELEDRFGKSKQKAFVQLINDPFYVEGVE